MKSKNRRSRKKWMTKFLTSETETRKALRQPRRRFQIPGEISRNLRRKPTRKSHRPSGRRQTFSTPAELNDDQTTEAGAPHVPASIGPKANRCQRCFGTSKLDRPCH